MAKITALIDLGKLVGEEFNRFASAALVELQSIVNGKLDFQTNFNCQIVNVTFMAKDTDFQVKHNLNRTDLNYLLISSDRSTNIYASATKPSSSAIFLKSTVANAVTKILLF